MAFADWDAPELVLVLVLTREEAEFLLAVLGAVRDVEPASYGDVSQEIFSAISDAGIDFRHDKYLVNGGDVELIPARRDA